MPSHPIADGPDQELAELVHVRSGRLLRAIFDTEPQCVKLLGPDGSLRLMNPAGLRMIEADSFDQVQGQCVFPLVVEEYRAAFQAMTERVFRGESASLEFRLVGLKGTPRWLETQAVPLRDDTGRVGALLGITREITDHVLANAALRESERNFRMLFEQATDGIFICDDDLRFLDVNPAACRITGYTREELLTLGVLDMLAPEDASLARDLPGFASGKVVTIEHPAIRKDGSRYLAEVTTKRLPDGRVQSFVRDVTERSALQSQILQVQKMESIGRLAGGIAHDFNNLLTIINGTADLAIAGLHSGHPLRQDLEHIRHAGERAAAVTRQLLAMSRQEILQPEVLNLNRIIRDMEGMLQRLAGEDITLDLALAERVGSIKGNPSQIEQVILNLAVNAHDAMPEGGTLTIETSDVESGRPSHHPLPAGPHVMLAVRDTGVGMDDAARKRVFEPFFTTKEIGKGTGLGLSIVYGIVKQSGGHVWVDSHPGGGTAFTIYFPRVETTLGPRPPAPAVGDAAEGNETILVVEDESAVRELTRRVLESAGYRVLTATSGVEALQMLEGSTETIHLMLTDVLMPGMNGRELALRVTGLRPDIKVLYMTGYTPDALLRRGVLDAANRVVSKPFTVLTLRRQVRETLDE
jgi:PAS domain S-box-containing protein